MKLWRRILYALISLVWGFISLDYLYLAYRLLTGADSTAQTYQPLSDGVRQLLGAGMFLLWFLILAFYAWLIRKSTFQIDILEKDKKTGKEKVHRKYFDLLFQAGMIVTGAVLRWCYLVFVLFPSRN